MKNRSLVSINDYSREEIIQILDLAEEFEKNPRQSILNGKVLKVLYSSWAAVLLVSAAQPLPVYKKAKHSKTPYLLCAVIPI